MSEATTTATIKTEEKSYPVAPSVFIDDLTLNHRCDGCGAAATSQVLVGETVILLCGHHTRKNLDALQDRKYLTSIPDGASYKFTDRELEKRRSEVK